VARFWPSRRAASFQSSTASFQYSTAPLAAAPRATGCRPGAVPGASGGEDHRQLPEQLASSPWRARGRGRTSHVSRANTGFTRFTPVYPVHSRRRERESRARELMRWPRQMPGGPREEPFPAMSRVRLRSLQAVANPVLNRRSGRVSPSARCSACCRRGGYVAPEGGGSGRSGVISKPPARRPRLTRPGYRDRAGTTDPTNHLLRLVTFCIRARDVAAIGGSSARWWPKSRT
jgi:hypothetical protein